MIERGVLQEVQENLKYFSQDIPSFKAIGSCEFMTYIQGKLSLENAIRKTIISTRQFAKRQRTWFRKNMADWKVFTQDH